MDGEKGCGCKWGGGVLNFLCESKTALKTKSIQKEKSTHLSFKKKDYWRS